MRTDAELIQLHLQLRKEAFLAVVQPISSVIARSEEGNLKVAAARNGVEQALFFHHRTA